MSGAQLMGPGVFTPASDAPLIAWACQVARRYAAQNGVPVVPALADAEATFRQAAALQVPAAVPTVDRSVNLPASFSVTVGGAARSLEISDRAVRAAAAEKRLHGRKDHRGWWRFEPQEIERYRKVPAGGERGAVEDR